MTWTAIGASERLLIAVWCILAVTTLSGTVAICIGSRFREHRLFGPLIPSSLAALPSLAFMLEVALRIATASISGHPVAATASASLLLKPWIFVGGVLLVCSFGMVPLRSVPLAANLARLGHIVLWSIGSLLSLQAISGV